MPNNMFRLDWFSRLGAVHERCQLTNSLTNWRTVSTSVAVSRVHSRSEVKINIVISYVNACIMQYNTTSLMTFNPDLLVIRNNVVEYLNTFFVFQYLIPISWLKD